MALALQNRIAIAKPTFNLGAGAKGGGDAQNDHLACNIGLDLFKGDVSAHFAPFNATGQADGIPVFIAENMQCHGDALDWSGSFFGGAGFGTSLGGIVFDGVSRDATPWSSVLPSVSALPGTVVSSAQNAAHAKCLKGEKTTVVIAETIMFSRLFFMVLYSI